MHIFKSNKGGGGKALVISILLQLAKDFQDITCKTSVSVSNGTLWSVPISSSVTLSCNVSFNVTPILSWCWEDGDKCLPLEGRSRHTLTWNHIGPGTGKSILTLHNITLSDSGQYRCVASQPDYCDPNSTVSPPLEIYVTRSGEVTDVCVKDEKPVCEMTGVIVDISRIILFVVATGAVMALILYRLLKARGNCSPPEVKDPRCLEELHQNMPPDNRHGRKWRPR